MSTTTTTTNKINFHIRPAVPSPTNDDAAWIVSAFDSCIPHLKSIGSAGQWGTKPLSVARPGLLQSRIDSIAESHAWALAGKGDPVKVVILEAETSMPGGEEGRVNVGSMTLRGNYFAGYLTQGGRSKSKLREGGQEKETEALLIEGTIKRERERLERGESKGWMYLEVLVTSFDEGAKEFRRGAGAALVQSAVRFAKDELGLERMYVDCWAGNGGRLVRFYEARGFEKVALFTVPLKVDERGDFWEGMFLKMELGSKGEE
ncbi:hypothetical protein V8F20_002848 [Naviculisporaceae sp. PSN 640]